MGIFRRIRNFFRIGREGLKTNATMNLQHITDHPKIGISREEFNRIQENLKLYAGQFPQISYMNSNGHSRLRDRRYINTPKIFANHLAKLVFNEGCKINVDQDEANEFLEHVLKTSKFHENFGNELEAAYAVNGVAILPYVKDGEIKIAYASADTFFPITTNNNIIEEAAIATRTAIVENEVEVFYTLLAFHEWEKPNYVITNELYRSESRHEVGERVRLNAIEQYRDLQERTVIENLSRPLFVYIKLAGKNNITSSPMGLGIIDNAKAQIQDINDKYDMFMWEVKEAKRRITAPEQFFRVGFNEKTGEPILSLDDDTSAFVRIAGEVGGKIEEFAPELRSAEFIETINFIIRVAEVSIGVSAGTFDFDGKSIKTGNKTATEVVSENSKTYQTRSNNVNLIKEALKDLIVTIFELAALYGIYRTDVDFGVDIDFDDGIFTDRHQEIDFYTKGVTMKTIPRVEVMQRLYNITESEAEEWLQKIVQEEKNFNPEYAAVTNAINLGTGIEI